MSAFSKASIAKLLLVAAGACVCVCAAPSISPHCGAHAFVISISAAPDTITPAKPAAPAKPSKPVKITISDEGIKIGADGEEKLILKVDDESLDKIDEKILEKLEGIPESLAAVFGGDEDRRFARVKGADLVQIGKTIRIESDELVNGDVVSIGSNIIIDGKVTGDVAAIFGSVELGSGAIVNGEVVSILGNVSRADGAIVRGETAVIGGRHGHRGLVYPLGPFGEGFFNAGARIVVFIIGILLLLMVFYFLGERMRRAGSHATGAFLKSFGVGLLVFFGGLVLVIILTIILAITIVGIPVAVLLDFSYIALLVLGYFVSAFALGDFLSAKFNLEGNSVYGRALIGLVALSIFGIVASFMFFNPILGPARIILRVISYCINFVAVMTGVGAFILSRAGSNALKPGSPPNA